jgi:hypothetical protein
MKVADVLLNQIQFVVDQHGQTTGVMVPVTAWQALVTWLRQLEDGEDRHLLRERLPGGRFSEAPDLFAWDTIESELGDDEDD